MYDLHKSEPVRLARFPFIIKVKTMPSQLLTTADVCRRLRISKTTLYYWRKKGFVRAVILGGSVRFREKDIDRLIAVGRRRTEPADGYESGF